MARYTETAQSSDDYYFSEYSEDEWDNMIDYVENNPLMSSAVKHNIVDISTKQTIATQTDLSQSDLSMPNVKLLDMVNELKTQQKLLVNENNWLIHEKQTLNVELGYLHRVLSPPSLQPLLCFGLLKVKPENQQPAQDSTALPGARAATTASSCHSCQSETLTSTVTHTPPTSTIFSSISTFIHQLTAMMLENIE
jgi:hypothetical protein